MSDARAAFERGVETWNAHDRAAWTGLFSPDATLSAPGGMTGSGPDTTELFYSIWQDAFPDCAVRNTKIVAEGDQTVLEGTFEGTQSGPLRGPGGEIGATGKRVSIPFVGMGTVRDGLFTSFRLYFDQLGLLQQLGVQ
jgi:ketosteroid isomerase-like protein